jgi:protoheme IX farnesyltransferase
MERTKERPSVNGRFQGNHILMVGIVQSVVGILLLLLTTSVAGVIGIIGLLVYVGLYTMWFIL